MLSVSIYKYTCSSINRNPSFASVDELEDGRKIPEEDEQGEEDEKKDLWPGESAGDTGESHTWTESSKSTTSSQKKPQFNKMRGKQHSVCVC